MQSTCMHACMKKLFAVLSVIANAWKQIKIIKRDTGKLIMENPIHGTHK